MIPAALYAMLAIARLGAIHTVVFGGFAPASLAQRLEGSKAVAVLTASCGIEGAKGPMSYKPFIEQAIEKSSHKPEKVLIWQREQLKWDPVRGEKGERVWQQLIGSAKERRIKAKPVPVNSDDGLYIIYTSGKYRPTEQRVQPVSKLREVELAIPLPYLLDRPLQKTGTDGFTRNHRSS